MSDEKRKPVCDRCFKEVDSEHQLFRMDFECISMLIEELNLLRSANMMLRRELEDKYWIVKTIYH